ncbi:MULTISPECIES: hypothetical protein [unclassified Microbacterium]|uniref:hypothetical protein n=1 Tax=unclassified Microbacterium TaxID=2609290 RepID=UPI00257CE9C6|nr:MULTISPECIES: hypothetical protein [unclassified Microbacterium]|tara:strand:+ start:2081 stop:2665 length:585 start_codon:yes stop_codon:yes gene_type:complete
MMLPESLATATVSAGLLLGMAMALIAVIVTTRRSSAVFVMIAAAIVAAMLITVVVVPTDVPLPIALPLALLGASVAVVGGNPLTREVLRLATKGTVRDGEHGGILLRSAREDDAAAVREVLLGGTTIGYLERVATTLTILVGFPEGLAVVVALKGIGRFSELASAEARERFIIGTLASLVWASAVAATVRLAIW